MSLPVIDNLLQLYPEAVIEVWCGDHRRSVYECHPSVQRIIDIPSGMAQEFVWPLALAYATDHPENPFRGQESLREWVRAGIGFAARSAHADGSCDDYFPYERAAGAAAFSLLAFLESCGELGLDVAAFGEFLRRRARWLAACEESGQLTNHQALIALCLERAGALFGTDEWDGAFRARLARVLEWQHDEGWFPEYEGFDPGYQTLTMWCLARLFESHPDFPGLRGAIERSVDLLTWFVHPDGSFGGEYASRNTYNYFPDGFERVGRWHPRALGINDRFLEGLARGLGSCDADDHILGHHTWNYLLAWRSFVAERPAPEPLPDGRLELAGAGVVVDRRADTTLYVALRKGGVFKLFRDGRLVASDTQVSLLVGEGKRRRNAVGHLVGDYESEVAGDSIRVTGSFGWAKQTQMTTWKLIALRLVTASVGRFAPNLIRGLLQKLLIAGKSDAPARFDRTLRFDGETWEVRDEIHCDDWSRVAAAGIGCDQTSIYVVMSRTFQAGQLRGWLDLTPRVRAAKAGEAVVLERTL